MRKCCVIGSAVVLTLLLTCPVHTPQLLACETLSEWITDALRQHVSAPAFCRRLDILAASSAELSMASYYHSPIDWTVVLNSETREIEILGSLSLYDGGQNACMRQIEALEVERAIAELESIAKSVILEIMDIRLMLHRNQRKSEYIRRGMAVMGDTYAEKRLLMDLQLQLDSIASESRSLRYQLSKKTNDIQDRVDIMSLAWPELELDCDSAVELIRTNPSICAAYRMYDIDSRMKTLLNSIRNTVSITAQLSARARSDQPLQTQFTVSATIPLGDAKWTMGTCNVETDGLEHSIYARLSKRKSLLLSPYDDTDWTRESADVALNDYVFSLEQSFDMLNLSETELLLVRDQIPDLSVVGTLDAQDGVSVVTAWIRAVLAEAEAEYRYRSSLFRILLLTDAFGEAFRRAMQVEFDAYTNGHEAKSMVE